MVCPVCLLILTGGNSPRSLSRLAKSKRRKVYKLFIIFKKCLITFFVAGAYIEKNVCGCSLQLIGDGTIGEERESTSLCKTKGGIAVI